MIKHEDGRRGGNSDGRCQLNGKTYAYLDLAVLPTVGAVLLEPKPAFVFRGDGSGILWANAAGAAFFGETAMGALLERRFSAANPTTRSLARLSKTLPGDETRLEILRFNFGVRQVTLPAACRRLDLGNGARGVLVAATQGGSRESLSTRAERLADAIAAEDCLVAVFDRDGKVLGASGGFDALAPASEAIDRLVGEAERGERPVARATLGVHGGERPAGVARVTVGAERVFLLIVGPEVARAEPPIAAPVETPPAPVELVSPPVAEAAPVETVATEEPAVEPVAEESPTGEPAAEEQPPSSPTRRFLWRTDGDLVFTFVSDQLAAEVGEASAPAPGTSWRALAGRLALDRDGELDEALSGLASFADITVDWPLADVAERVAVDLTGMPSFSRERVFEGYRGFGVIRTGDRTPDAQPRPVETEPVAEAETPAPETEAPSVEATEPPEPDNDIVAEEPVAPEPPVELSDDLDDVAREIVEGGHMEDAEPEAVEEEPTASETPEEAAPSPAAPTETSNVVHLTNTPTRILPRRLSGIEQDAFRRIAEELGAKTHDEDETPPPPEHSRRAGDKPPVEQAPPDFDATLLDKLPVGIAVYRDSRTLFANRTLLDLLGYASLDEFLAAGGTEAIFPDRDDWSANPLTGGRLHAAHRDGKDIAVDAKLHAVVWAEATALMLSLVETAEEPAPVAPADEAPAESPPADERVRELEAMLDTATDGVVVIDRDGLVGGMNRSAEALFGTEADMVRGKPFTDLLADESRRGALDYLDGLASNGVASILNDGREVIGKVPRGGLIPLFMTIGRLADSGKYCAVLRDITHWKNVEEELVAARRAAETANAQKSDFLAKISHEIRTPLNAIIGFSEVMMAERFGPIDNERYRNYLRDIHLSGEHLMSLINDLLDLSKVEAGKLDMNFESVAVNEAIQEIVALMQPQANRERIIIRTSLSAGLPNIVADLRSLRQILLNLLSNAIKFTKAGGQVIVATAIEESGEVVLRIRDTGIGMSEKDIDIAMKPFRQVATSGKVGEGTGLGLPLTKALVEANRAAFAIDSVPDQGTLVRVTFPTTRVLAG